MDSAAQRTEAKSGETVPQNPAERIQNYLDRFKEITERTDPDKRERGMDALKQVLYEKFVIKSDDIPQSYYNLQGEIAIREGRQADLEQGGVEIRTGKKRNFQGEEVEVRNFIFPGELKEQAAAQVTNNQRHSLDKWVDYLASDDAQYPNWAKYWAFRSVLDMGKLQKKEDEHGRVMASFGSREFARRNAETGKLANSPTVASFPPLNPRALALTIGVLRDKLEQQAKPKKERQLLENKSARLSDIEFQKLLSTEDFSKLYAQFLIEMPEYSAERLQETRGAWATFPQGSDPMTYQPTIIIEGQEYTGKPLVPSLEGYPLEWCTADPDTARTQLNDGDFHVYYSVNDLDEPVIPRLAIRMEGDRIGEPPRGIAPDQNLDPYIAPVLQKKLKAFGSKGEAFEKRAADMQHLTRIEKEIKEGSFATKDKDEQKRDLMFLYEIETTIEGFGYQRDPRIEELRNTHEDAPTVLDCTPEQTAWSADEVNENTKAYIGELSPGIFTKLADVDHIYTSFPESRIRRGSVAIGNIPKDNIQDVLIHKKIFISSRASDLLLNPDFTVIQNPERVDYVKLTVGELGFLSGATTEKIYAKADELGLDLCEAEMGPSLCLQEETDDSLYIGMKPIALFSGYSSIFHLHRTTDNDRSLTVTFANGSQWWPSESTFVFRLPIGKNELNYDRK